MLNHSSELVWQAFDHAATSYEDASYLQRLSAAFLMNLMQVNGDFLPHKQGLQWVDLGCGTGFVAKEIARRGCPVCAVDQSLAMLSHVENINNIEIIQSDIGSLPFADQSIGRLVSHFAVHWLGVAVLPELRRVMQLGGTMWLAIPVEGSFASVQARYPALPVFDFLPATIWLEGLRAESFEIVTVVEKNWSQSFSHLQALLHCLKKMGGHRLGREQLPVSAVQFRQWLRDAAPIALEYQVLYVQVRR